MINFIREIVLKYIVTWQFVALLHINVRWKVPRTEKNTSTFVVATVQSIRKKSCLLLCHELVPVADIKFQNLVKGHAKT